MTKDLGAVEPTDEMLGLARQLLDATRQITQMRPEYDVQCSLKGLSAAIIELYECGGSSSPSELAKKLGVSDARIANILRALQEKGFVVRTPSQNDKRRAEVSLTQEGINEYKHRKDEAERVVANFLDELGEEDSKTTIYILNRFVQTIDALRAKGYRPKPLV